MNIKTFELYDELSLRAAEDVTERIKDGIKNNGKFVLGLATGSTPIGMYQQIIPLLGNFSPDLSELYTFNLDEYYNLPRTHPCSYYNEMMRNLWKPLHDINPTFKLEHAHIPNGSAENIEEECARYEAEIKKQGGVDLQILGIGTNGHIAFNEPGSDPKSRTRRVDIVSETRRNNAKKFFDNDISKVPVHAISMGIGTILESKEIFLLISGEAKRPIYEKLTTMTTPSSDVPASYLHTHPNVTIYTDLK